MFLCRWKHDQLVAEFWLKLLSLFTKAQGKAETVLCSFPLPNWSQYLLTTSLSKVHTVLNAYTVSFTWLWQPIWTFTPSSIMNSIIRLILRGKAFPSQQKRYQNLWEIWPASCTVYAQENQEPVGRSLRIPAMCPCPRMGGRNRTRVGNWLFHQQKYQGVCWTSPPFLAGQP